MMPSIKLTDICFNTKHVNLTGYSGLHSILKSYNLIKWNNAVENRLAEVITQLNLTPLYYLVTIFSSSAVQQICQYK